MNWAENLSSAEVFAVYVTAAISFLVWILRKVVQATQQYGFIPISRERRKFLEGSWAGRFDQAVGLHGPFSGEISLTLKPERRKVEGQCHLKATLNSGVTEHNFKVFGGYFHDRFLVLDYRSVKEGTIHFGSLLLEFEGDAVLHGRYLGYGPNSKQLVHGTIRLSKCPKVA